MAFVPLNIAPLWRPWRQAGVTHLLLDPAALKAPPVEEAEESAPEQSTPSAPGSTPRRALRQGPCPARPVPPPAPPIRTRPAHAGASSARIAPPDIELPAPGDWPAAWKELLARCGSAHPRIVWTYTGLADDLGGRADGQRRNFFARLFRDLGMPKGSHAFWPLWPPAAAEALDARFFLSGVRALNPDSVVLMCDEAPALPGLSRVRPFQPVLHQGRRYVLIQDPASLAGALAEAALKDPRAATPRYIRMVSFLKSLHVRG